MLPLSTPPPTTLSDSQWQPVVDAVPAARWRAWVPGRIEVFGKHTDYGGGESLVCATEQGLRVAARPIDDPVLRVRSLDQPQVAEIPLDEPTDAADWTTYPRAVVRRLRLNFGDALRGAEIALASDLPPAAGLSSSSALVVAIFLVLAARSGLHEHPLAHTHLHTPEGLAHYLGCVENGASFGPLLGERGVGTSGGSQDHAAILCSQPGVLLHVGFHPLRRLRQVPWPADHVFALAVSGVTAEKTGAARAAYNAVSTRAAAVVRAFNDATGGEAATLQDVVTAGPPPLDAWLSPDLRDRFEQFTRETQIHLPKAIDAIARGDLATFGEAAFASHREAAAALHHGVLETDFLVASAGRLGAAGASAFGAGFGGSVWAILPAKEAATFLTRWADEYAAAFPQRRPSFLTTRPARAAFVELV